MSRTVFCIVLAFLSAYPLQLSAMELQTKYVTVQYASRQLLSDWHGKIGPGKKGDGDDRPMAGSLSVEDGLPATLDSLVERVQTALEMFPAQLHFSIVLLEDAAAVASVHLQKYGKNIDNIAFYSLSADTIYISVEDMHFGVLVHELSHAVIDNYFDFRLPYDVYELMAQFTEKQIFH
jgi:hypothetical protein